MSLFDKLLEIYPELTIEDFTPNGTIELQDDSDGNGAYIKKWDYIKPIPNAFKLGK